MRRKRRAKFVGIFKGMELNQVHRDGSDGVQFDEGIKWKVTSWDLWCVRLILVIVKGVRRGNVI